MKIALKKIQFRSEESKEFDESRWTHPPFGAEFYARGAQYMKCRSTQYLGAISALKQQENENEKLQRTIRVTYVSEEIKVEFGMNIGRALNVGIAMDQPPAFPFGGMLAFYAERTGGGTTKF